ncbi:MAG: hypothetical protein HY722_00830 [Planctomycetes bacterium]|nr:hypothetical protein [Planctomycetota bacterium]
MDEREREWSTILAPALARLDRIYAPPGRRRTPPGPIRRALAQRPIPAAVIPSRLPGEPGTRVPPGWLGEALRRVKEPWVLRPTWRPAPPGAPPARVRAPWVRPEWPDLRLPAWPCLADPALAHMGRRSAAWRRELRMRMRVPYERQREGEEESR